MIAGYIFELNQVSALTYLTSCGGSSTPPADILTCTVSSCLAFLTLSLAALSGILRVPAPPGQALTGQGGRRRRGDREEEEDSSPGQRRGSSTWFKKGFFEYLKEVGRLS